MSEFKCILFGHTFQPKGREVNGIQIEWDECGRCGLCRRPRLWTPPGFTARAVPEDEVNDDE